MRRWLFRIFIALAALIVLVVVIVQVVLWTATPRNLILSQVQRQLGLRMSAKSASTGWFGTTVLRDVTMSLPLADESFFDIPRLEVEHTWLPSLLVGGSLEIEALELNEASLVIRENEAGRWNVQEVFELLQRTLGKKQVQTTEGSKPPKLPQISIRDGTILITDRKNRNTTLKPVQFEGQPDGPIIWRYKGSVPQQLTLDGQLAPGGNWQHQVDVEAHLGRLLEPWMGQLETPFGVNGQWRGQIDGGRVSGRIQLDQLTLGGVTASGATEASFVNGVLTLRPQDLLVRDAPALPEAKIVAGTMIIKPSQIQLDQIEAQTLNGLVLASGLWTFSGNSGNLALKWDDVEYPANVTESGQLNLSVKSPFPGGPQVVASLQSQGKLQAGEGEWETQMTITGHGSSWGNMSWDATIPKLNWAGLPRPIHLRDLVAKVAVHDRVVELTSLEMAGEGSLSGAGKIDLTPVEGNIKGDWSLNLIGAGVPVPVTQSQATFRLDASGNLVKYDLQQLSFQTGDLNVMLKGDYDRRRPKPLEVHLDATHVPSDIGESDQTLRGQFAADIDLVGTMSPVELSLKGRVKGEGLYVKNHPLGDPSVVIEGKATLTRAEIESEEMQLLGGKWKLAGFYRGSTEHAQLELSVQDLPMEQLAAMMGQANALGMIDGKFTVILPHYQISRISADGTFQVENLQVAQLSADKAEGELHLRNGRVRVDPLRLENDEGRATVAVSMPLARPLKPSLSLDVKDWPVDLPRAAATMRLSANGRLDLNLNERSAVGTIKLSSPITLRDQPLGDARLEIVASGRTIALRDFETDLLGGRIQGSGQINLDQPLGSSAAFTWSDISAESLVAIYPELEGLGGHFGGTLRIEPATDPRALEPLRLNLIVDSYDGSFRGADIGDATLTAFMNYQRNPRGQINYRIVLSDTQNDPSLIRLADGIVRVWGRASRSDIAESSHLSLDLDRLDLDQIVHAFNSKADPMPGRISGKLNLISSGRDRSRVFGNGNLSIEDSDLGKVDALTVLYDAMNIGTDTKKPTGSGSTDLRLEGTRLSLINARYFNRGAEVRTQLDIDDTWNILDTPIAGAAVGTGRPLKNIDLPLLADVDDISNVLQQEVTTVDISGTLRKPQIKLVPFSAISGSMRRFLYGDVRAETRGGVR